LHLLLLFAQFAVVIAKVFQLGACVNFFCVLYIRKQQVNVLSYDTKGNLATWSLVQLLDSLRAYRPRIQNSYVEFISQERYLLNNLWVTVFRRITKNWLAVIRACG
jgi:hypothetical protein